jgi:5-methylcytosine-specific restriction endonuclease McrA
MKKNHYQCLVCDSTDLTLHHEASYVYSYIIDSDAPGLKNTDEFLSFLYDKREQKDTRTYIMCNSCGTQYPYHLLNEKLNRITPSQQADASSGDKSLPHSMPTRSDNSI